MDQGAISPLASATWPIYGSLSPRSLMTVRRPVCPIYPPTSRCPSAFGGRSACGFSGEIFTWFPFPTQVILPAGPFPATVTVTDSFSPFIITDSIRVPVMILEQAARPTGEGR